MDKATISAVMSELGRRTSAAKAAAAKRNGAAPCAPGKRRGWPKGKKRLPKTPVNGL